MLFTPERFPTTSTLRNSYGVTRYTRRLQRTLLISNLILLILLTIFLIISCFSVPHHKGKRIHRTELLSSPSSSRIYKVPFQPPEDDDYRIPDSIDTFATYKYRGICNISSLDLHSAFSPLCTDRRSLLEAMSSGGRIGFDSPFMPRDCDMRWFSSEEVCEILSRFTRVIIVGDSMMRHVIGSINVLLRKDLGYGAVTDWNFSEQERKDCFCNFQFNVKACSLQGIFQTGDVAENDPSSLSCPLNTVDVKIETMIKFPIPGEELQRLKDSLPETKPKKPIAFVLGHGLWNDLDLQATLDWLDTIIENAIVKSPWLLESQLSERAKDAAHISDGRRQTPVPEHQHILWPRLFMTPNAAGKAKPDQWLVSQGDKALMVFEDAVKEEVTRRGMEHIGTWNMSIQSNKFDGVHLDLKGNMIKAMMVINWLNMIEVESF